MLRRLQVTWLTDWATLQRPNGICIARTGIARKGSLWPFLECQLRQWESDDMPVHGTVLRRRLHHARMLWSHAHEGGVLIGDSNVISGSVVFAGTPVAGLLRHHVQSRCPATRRWADDSHFQHVVELFPCDHHLLLWKTMETREDRVSMWWAMLCLIDWDQSVGQLAAESLSRWRGKGCFCLVLWWDKIQALA